MLHFTNYCKREQLGSEMVLPVSQKPLHASFKSQRFSSPQGKPYSFKLLLLIFKLFLPMKTHLTTTVLDVE